MAWPPSTHQDVKDAITALQTSVAAKAPAASPAFTGTPTAPTASSGTSTTQVATTAFVAAALAAFSGGGGSDADALMVAVYSGTGTPVRPEVVTSGRRCLWICLTSTLPPFVTSGTGGQPDDSVLDPGDLCVVIG